jgi:hypothetical protein
LPPIEVAEKGIAPLQMSKLQDSGTFWSSLAESGSHFLQISSSGLTLLQVSVLTRAFATTVLAVLT